MRMIMIAPCLKGGKHEDDNNSAMPGRRKA